MERVEALEAKAPTPAEPQPLTVVRAADPLVIPDGETPPPIDPDKGDMTPDYARWIVATQPAAVSRERYFGRERHLPVDVQIALKGAA